MPTERETTFGKLLRPLALEIINKEGKLCSLVVPRDIFIEFSIPPSEDKVQSNNSDFILKEAIVLLQQLE